MRRDSNVGAGLLAKAQCQLACSVLTHRIREQARSHLFDLHQPWGSVSTLRKVSTSGVERLAGPHRRLQSADPSA